MRRIILVEDSPSDELLFRLALDHHAVEYLIEVFRDGEKARTRASAAEQDGLPADLIVLDLNLPSCDGFEVLTAFRDNPRYAGVPVVVLTSSDSPSQRKRAAEMGAADYFAKPVLLNDFMALGGRIRELLERASAPA